METVIKPVQNGRSYSVVVGLLVPALVGATFGTASSFLVVRYQQVTNVESLQTAYFGGI